jgi:PhzF family phenazine biosynthesis protein
MANPYFALIDTFADLRFSGNPAGVCIGAESLSDEAMQLLAMEVNQAETAFVHSEGSQWRLRWFTPVCEVDLCGHATMAAAVALWRQKSYAIADTIEFKTRSGLLTATKKTSIDDPSGIMCELNFPSEPVVHTPAPALLLESLGLSRSSYEVYRNRMDYLVEIDSVEQLLSLQPDMRKLASVETRGVIVTVAASIASRSGKRKSDFVSRFFAPRCGVDEDPATGSAHCALYPYWRDKLGREGLVGYQASRRGGWIECSGSGDRVLLRGRSFCSVEGSCLIGNA